MESILALLTAMVISMMTVAGFLTWTKVGLANIKNAATSSQQVIFNKAVEQYVQDYNSTLAAIATAATPVTITSANLQALSYLPAGFTGTNAFGQTWQAQVLQPSAGQLMSVVMSIGGTAISDPKQLVQIAAQTGAQGGFVPYAGMLGNAAYTTTTAAGAFGGWTLPMGAFTNPGSGHLVSLLAFSSASASNGYLYRVAVPGQPQLNAMQTDLSLTDSAGTAHNINGIATANAAAVNATGAVTAGTFSGAGGNFNTDGQGRIGTNGNSAANLPGGWTGGVSTVDVYGRGTVGVGTGGSVSAYMSSNGAIQGGNGQFQVSANGVVSLGAQGASGASCSVGGGSASITTDTAGVILSCQGGTWKPIGGRQQKAAFYLATDGMVIPNPGCPATAIPQIIVVPNNIYIDPTATATYTSSGTGPWTVLIRDGANAPMPGGVAQVETYCAYN